MSQNNENTNEKEEKEIQVDNEQAKKVNSNLVDKATYDELNDRYMRVLAEFENFKKRNAKEKTLLYSSVVSEVMESILPIMDNLENALKTHTDDEEYKKGIELIKQQLENVLESNGVQTIQTQGQTFDPELHEAISMVDSSDHESSQIVEEYRKGYKIGDKVIRHSMVVVAN